MDRDGDDSLEGAVHTKPTTNEVASDTEKEALKTFSVAENAADIPESFPEGGYGWVVVVASFFGSFMFPLCLATYGLFHVVLVEELGRSRGETALIGSVTYLFTTGTGPLASFLCNLIGHRGTCILGGILASAGYLISAFTSSFELLFFSYGCLIGIGISLQLIPTMVLVQFYFKKRRALAVGIVRTGSGVGGLVLPPIVQLFIDEYSWRGAMVLLAGFALQGCVIGALLRPNEKSNMSKISIRDRQRTYLRESLISNLDYFKDSRLLICLLVQFSEGVHSVIFYYLLPDRVVGFGFTTDQAAFLLFLTGISSTITRLATGVLTNHFRLNSIVQHGCAFLLMAIAHFLLSLLSNPSFGLLVTISVVFGLGVGVTTCNLILLMLQLFGIHRMTVALGWALLAEGIGGFIGPPVGGAIFDMTGSYTYSFLLSGAFAVTACLLTIPVFLINKYKFKQTATTNSDESFN